MLFTELESLLFADRAFCVDSPLDAKWPQEVPGQQREGTRPAVNA